MGFPVGYSELPGLLLHAILLLGYIRRLISWAFASIGLGDLLDSDAPWPDPPSETPARSPVILDDILPVVRYDSLRRCWPESCAVCLQEIKGPEEVRKLSNCRHTFHRQCLDRWMGHAQRTCPLCRAPLFPEEPPAVEGCVPYDWLYEDESYQFASTTPLPAIAELRFV